jgi:hypothetical protein
MSEDVSVEGVVNALVDPGTVRFLERRSQELVHDSRRLIAASRLTREAARWMRARSDEVRLQRPGPRCPVCLWPFEPDDDGYAAAYVPDAYHVPSPMDSVHRRCQAAWILSQSGGGG